MILMEKKFLERFTKKNSKNQILCLTYFKWKGYSSYFNNWIDKKDIV